MRGPCKPQTTMSFYDAPQDAERIVVKEPARELVHRLEDWQQQLSEFADGISSELDTILNDLAMGQDSVDVMPPAAPVMADGSNPSVSTSESTSPAIATDTPPRAMGGAAHEEFSLLSHDEESSTPDMDDQARLAALKARLATRLRGQMEADNPDQRTEDVQ